MNKHVKTEKNMAAERQKSKAKYLSRRPEKSVTVLSGRNTEVKNDRRRKNLTGQRFGRLVALEPTNQKEDRYIIWKCKCDCGKVCLVSTKRLCRGTITNCGCEAKQSKRNGSKAADLTGMVFGNLTALYRVENKNNRTRWHCRCSCGNEIDVTTHDLRTGHVKSCGCYRKEHAAFVDLKGKRIGQMTVIEKTEKRDRKGSVIWLCRCDCGNYCNYTADSLMHGSVVSCGCYKKKELSRQLPGRLHHIDGTCVESLLRTRLRSDNKTGYTGVTLTRDGRYVASIGFKGKRYYLGRYEKLQDAVSARKKGEEMHSEFLEWYYSTHAENDP